MTVNDFTIKVDGEDETGWQTLYCNMLLPSIFPQVAESFSIDMDSIHYLAQGRICSALTFGNEDGGLFHHTALYFTLMSLHSKLSSRSRCKRLALGVLPNERRPNKVLHTLLTWEMHLGICLVSRAWVHMCGSVGRACSETLLDDQPVLSCIPSEWIGILTEQISGGGHLRHACWPILCVTAEPTDIKGLI